MNSSTLLRLQRSLKPALAAIVTSIVLTACSDSPAAPDLDPVTTAGPALGSCEILKAPAGTTFGFRAYARGVQIYRWNGSAWALVGPRADLFANSGENAKIGAHYTGPYWEAINGSKVKGTLVDRCPVGANAIDWLSLSAAPEGPSGMFSRIVFIQRVNTAGGKAPATPGVLDEIQEVPYSAEYYFYRGK